MLLFGSKSPNEKRSILLNIAFLTEYLNKFSHFIRHFNYLLFLCTF